MTTITNVYVNVRGEEFTANYSTFNQSKGRVAHIKVDGRGFNFYPWLYLTSIFSIVGLALKITELPIALLTLAAFFELLTLFYRMSRKIVSETLLIVPRLGVQSTSRSMTGRNRKDFIPWSQMIDIVITETVTMQQVLFFMALLIKSEGSSEEKVIPLFLHVWPRLVCLQEIYRICQNALARDAS